MLKKLIIGVVSVVVIAAGVAGMSAFEAHVINVTAQIENGLEVNTTPIEFGTVFPQEYFDNKTIEIGVSQSFIDEDRVDDIEYIIKQKPKPRDPKDALYCHQNLPEVPYEPNSAEWSEYLAKCYYPLCPYLSKTDADPNDQNDGPNVPAFHEMDVSTFGRLAKSQSDLVDLWVIDLDVPCFRGQCAQDWTHQGWELPQELEGQVFGCDLWVEVNGISRTKVLKLENKDPSTWTALEGDEIQGVLVYRTAGPSFDYTLTAQGLTAGVEYSLIYYADKQDRFTAWGGDNPGALLGVFITDGSGVINSGFQSIDLGIDLPHADDWNENPSPDYCDKHNGYDDYDLCAGAKIWLVPSSDYNEANKALTAWNPTQYLFETDMVLYNDTDTP